MTIIWTYEVDNSAALAKRFASQTRGYFDNPLAAKDNAAKVPLENVYRMLEMFRYDAFEDESRRGVLALENVDETLIGNLDHSAWHTAILTALNRALTEAFGGSSKGEAIDTLEDSLRRLIKGDEMPAETKQRAKGFFAAFEAQV